MDLTEEMDIPRFTPYIFPPGPPGNEVARAALKKKKVKSVVRRVFIFQEDRLKGGEGKG